MNIGLVLCLVTALGFAAWPLISRYSGANEAWVAVIVMLVTPFVAGAFQVDKLNGLPSWNVVGLLVLAGACNGIGMIAYSKIVAGNEYEVSGLAPASLTLMIAFIAIGGIIFFGEDLTWRKGAGVTLALVAAWLLA